ncbi:unnamed protein product [Cylindrotheca closterium]|uniref:Uncharacterized protein n=1 Tax=Cylindrotheca closterium TaxID=2856 RepID=A0AAD2CIS1_9STRA|nr:unnamed protein product [Cylindrotheca closterium]
MQRRFKQTSLPKRNTVSLMDLEPIMSRLSATEAATVGAKMFLLWMVLFAVYNATKVFFRVHGWRHRLAGGVHLLWLFVGAWTANCTSDTPDSRFSIFVYDILLGIFGTAATLTAARDFPHKLVSNAVGQSGTLHKKAIVTQAEMIEHSFYQALNLWQAIYLHALHYFSNSNQQRVTNSVLLFLVTMPWLFRHLLPVHSFSHNWKVYLKQQNRDTNDSMVRNTTETRTAEKGKSKNTATGDLEVFLYRIKKWQYVFYKHVILHGVNISLAVASTSAIQDSAIPYSRSWRIFWVLLNTSYVMEFFLQSMVKARVLSQFTMLRLQRFLMTISSLSALVVLRHVRVWICFSSLILNFVHRHHDLGNTMGISFVASMWNELHG